MHWHQVSCTVRGHVSEVHTPHGSTGQTEAKDMITMPREQMEQLVMITQLRGVKIGLKLGVNSHTYDHSGVS